MPTNPKQRHNLTQSFLSKLQPPVTGYRIFFDQKTAGFGVRVTSGDKRTFVVQGRVHGKELRVTIGSCDHWSIDKARDEAKAVIVGMNRGADPREARRAAKAATITLRQIADEYLARPGKLKATSQSQIERHVVTTFKDKEHRPITEITEKYVRERYDYMLKGGLHGDREGGSPGQAIQSHAILRALLNYAIRNRKGITVNPCLTAVNVDNRAKLNERESYIQQSKIGTVWNWLNGQRESAATGAMRYDFIRFLLLSGCRLREASALTWDRVSLDEGEPWWHLPDPKNRQPFWHPLSTQSLAILKARREDVPKSVPWVFPSNRSKAGHIVAPRDLLKQLSVIAGQWITDHDLRRSFTTYGIADCKIDLYKIELLTSHKPTGVVLKHYAKTMTQRLHWLRPEVQQVADWIEKQALIAASGNVIQLQRKAG